MLAALPSRAQIRNFARLLGQVQTLEAPDAETDRLGALEWSKRYAYVQLATGQKKPFSESIRDYQVDILEDTSKLQLVLKSRQLGISQIYAFKAAEEAIAGGTVLVVSKSLEQAALFLEYVYTAMENAPHAPFIAENKYTMKLANGGTVVCQPATRKAGRGIPATLVILDEYAWQEYAREILTAVIPTLSTTNGTLVILSTPNGMGNSFEELVTAARDPEKNIDEYGNKAWSLHELPWSVHPDWDDVWAARQRRVMGELAFAQEHDIDFVGSGVNLFSPEDINAFFTLAEWSGPKKGHAYLSAFDIGRNKDAFSGWTIDVSTSPFTVVHLEYHHRLPYPQQAQVINAVWETYPGRVLVEANNAGDPVIEFTQETYGTPIEPFITSSSSKKNIIDALMLALERRWIRSPEVPQARIELRNYLRKDDKLSQDTVISLAIAAWAVGQPVMDVSYLGGGQRTTLDPHSRTFEAPKVIVDPSLPKIPGVNYVGA